MAWLLRGGVLKSAPVLHSPLLPSFFAEWPMCQTLRSAGGLKVAEPAEHRGWVLLTPQILAQRKLWIPPWQRRRQRQQRDLGPNTSDPSEIGPVGVWTPGFCRAPTAPTHRCRHATIEIDGPLSSRVPVGVAVL